MAPGDDNPDQDYTTQETGTQQTQQSSYQPPLHPRRKAFQGYKFNDGPVIRPSTQQTTQTMGATDQQFSTAPISEARGQRSEGAESITAANAFRSGQLYAPTPQRFNNFQLPKLNDLPNAPLSPVRGNAHPSVELGQNQYTPQDVRSTAY